jgi:hypothetical protein
MNRDLENGRRLARSRLGEPVAFSSPHPRQTGGGFACSGTASTHIKSALMAAFVGGTALALGGCGLNSLTSGLGSSVFGGSSAAAAGDASKVSEEQLLSAAKSSDGSTGAVEVATGCPKVIAAPRDNNLTIYEPGRVGDGLAIVHRGEITKTARECVIEGNKVIVKYGFSGRVLLGPRGKSGPIVLPIAVAVADSKRAKVATDTLKVDTSAAIENPIGYFSAVRIISFDIPEGARAGEYEVNLSFERSTPNSG